MWLTDIQIGDIVEVDRARREASVSASSNSELPPGTAMTTSTGKCFLHQV